jgi:hypothetical protein
MGKTTLNSALSKISGRVDNWVYRLRAGQMLITKRPDFSGVVPSQAQLDVRQRFSEARRYAQIALANPVLRAFYAERAKGTLSNAGAEATTDYLRPPTVHNVDLAQYHGAIGNVITVEASDDTGIVGVTVTLRDAAQAVIESGPAALVNGRWTYQATEVVAIGASVVIEAEASDRPGNVGRMTVPLVVA